MEKNNLKIFFIKLASVTFSIIVIINVIYNLILADKLEKINNLFELDKNTIKTFLYNLLKSENKKLKNIDGKILINGIKYKKYLTPS